MSTSRRAWMGGSRPSKLLQVSELERQLRHDYFQSQMQAVVKHWGDYVGLCGSAMDQARVQYRHAKYDAHATVRRAL